MNLLIMYKFHLDKFDNGLRVLTVPSKESLSFAIAILVNVGSDFENKKINGISHFLEHLCFKGTKKRPTNLDIVRELDSVGADYNAFTDNEVTAYWIKVAAKDRDLALDIVSDIYLNSQLPEEEVEKEKGVIIEEINMHYDDPKIYVWHLWNKMLYGNQPAGCPIVGTKESVKNLKREDFFEYRHKYYRAKSTLISLSGNFNRKYILKKIKERFYSIAPGKGKSKPLTKEFQQKPRILFHHKKTDQAHFIFGFRGINIFDKRKYPLYLLDTVLDGGMSGILFQTVREKLGAAYYVSSHLSLQTDCGFWTVSAGIDNNRLEEIAQEILKEWKKFGEALITSKEIKKAKNYITGKVALGTENVHNVAGQLALQEILIKKIETPSEFLRKIKQITSRDLLLTARSLLKPPALNFVLIGPQKDKRRLERLFKKW